VNKTLKIRTKTFSAEIKYPFVLGILLIVGIVLAVTAKIIPYTYVKVYLAFGVLIDLGVIVVFYGRGLETSLEDDSNVTSFKEPPKFKETPGFKVSTTSKKVSATSAMNKQTYTRQSNAPMNKVPIPVPSQSRQSVVTPTADEIERQVQEKVKAVKNDADARWEHFLGEFENE